MIRFILVSPQSFHVILCLEQPLDRLFPFELLDNQLILAHLIQMLLVIDTFALHTFQSYTL